MLNPEARNATERRLTLLDLVAAANEFARDEHEALAVIRSLLASGRVRLAGGFRECHLRPAQPDRPARLAS